MRSGKRNLLRLRAACVLVSAVALFFVLRRIRFESLGETLRTMSPLWFVAATLVYGLLFLPAAARWHLALGLTQSAFSFGATLRVSLIGHFFYTILFGAAGGDTAKSVLYARWYERPLPGILAAASLDRLLGLGGLLLFSGAALGLGFAEGGLAGLGNVSLRWPWWWLAVAFVVVGLLLFGLKRLPSSSLPGQFAAAFVSSGRKLVASPGRVISGVGCGLGVQLALSAVLAFNLEAVSDGPLPWMRLAWTFPIITVISALPITVAGIGTRESAALVLFGFCGVPEASAVAASLLTAIASLIWTVVGGLLLWRSTRAGPDSVLDLDDPLPDASAPVQPNLKPL